MLRLYFRVQNERLRLTAEEPVVDRLFDVFLVDPNSLATWSWHAWPSASTQSNSNSIIFACTPWLRNSPAVVILFA